MHREALLIGSVPLGSAEEVFRFFGPSLGPHLPAIPDGELGERKWWVQRLARQVYSNHPQIEVLDRPPAEDLKDERLLKKGRPKPWQFRLRPGVKEVRFDGGLGYVQDAVESYQVFKRLRDGGVLPPGLRFQVCLALPNSSASPTMFASTQDLSFIRESLGRALKSEAAEIAKRIPHEDLAIQWDGSWEITDIYGGVPDMQAPPEQSLERNVAPLRGLSDGIPEGVMLGYHLCFGTFGGWPRFAPPDLGRAVAYANAAIAATGRRVDWMHLPTLDTVQDAFYQPLRDLKAKEARVYLGMVHSMPTFEARLAVARRHLSDFGVAAYCGFGRQPPSELPSILRDHLHAVRSIAA